MIVRWLLATVTEAPLSDIFTRAGAARPPLPALPGGRGPPARRRLLPDGHLRGAVRATRVWRRGDGDERPERPPHHGHGPRPGRGVPRRAGSRRRLAPDRLRRRGGARRRGGDGAPLEPVGAVGRGPPGAGGARVRGAHHPRAPGARRLVRPDRRRRPGWWPRRSKDRSPAGHGAANRHRPPRRRVGGPAAARRACLRRHGPGARGGGGPSPGRGGHRRGAGRGPHLGPRPGLGDRRDRRVLRLELLPPWTAERLHPRPGPWAHRARHLLALLPARLGGRRGGARLRRGRSRPRALFSRWSAWTLRWTSPVPGSWASTRTAPSR